MLSHEWLFAALDHSPPGSSVHEFPRQEYWSVLPFPTPGDLPDAEIESISPALQVDSLPLNHGGIQRDSMLEYSSKSDCMKDVKV